MSIAMPAGWPPGATGQRAMTLRVEIDYGDEVLVFEVDVGLAGAVGGEELRRAAEIDGGDLAVWGRCPGGRPSGLPSPETARTRFCRGRR